MRQRVEIEAWRLADAADLQVRALVRTVGHLFGRQVRQARQERVDLLAQSACLVTLVIFKLLGSSDHLLDISDISAGFLCGANVAAELISQGLCLLHPRLGGPPSSIKGQNVLRLRLQAPAFQAAVEGVGVLPDPA